MIYPHRTSIALTDDQREHSMLTFETGQFQGTANIIEKLTVSRGRYVKMISVDMCRTFHSRKYNTKSTQKMHNLHTRKAE